MADYEDQNSSEYKDTQPEAESPAPQNQQQNNGQEPGWRNGNEQQPPLNHGGQEPNWQNEQIPPQNNGQNPYWQNGQQPPYNNQPPYWQNQPQRPRRAKNTFATISLISGIFALLTLCCFAFPLAIICGVGAVCFAVISKKDQPFRGTAIAGIILGVIAVLLGIGEFFYMMTITNLLKDPANAAAFNEFFEQFQQQFQFNLN